MSLAAWMAGLAVIAAAAPIAEAVKLPVTDAARARAVARGNGHPLRCRDGITWRRLDLGPRAAPVVLMVHGLTTPSPVYDALAVRLATAGWRVVSYDLYGRGLSDAVTGPYDMPLYLRQIEDMLDHAGAQGPAVMVGYSMGGALVTGFAAQSPERVRHLCLLAPGGMGHAPDPLSRFCKAVPGFGDWAIRILGPASLRRVADAAARGRSDVPGIAAVMEAETHRRGYMPAVLSSLRHVLARDQSEEHQKISAAGVPTLAIWGREDTVIPLSAADHLHAVHPQAERVEIAGAEHGLTFTHSAQVATALLDRIGAPDAD